MTLHVRENLFLDCFKAVVLYNKNASTNTWHESSHLNQVQGSRTAVYTIGHTDATFGIRWGKMARWYVK